MITSFSQLMTDKLDRWLSSIQESNTWVKEPQVKLYRELLSRFVTDEGRFTPDLSSRIGSAREAYRATDTLTGKAVFLIRWSDSSSESNSLFGELLTLATNEHPATLKLVAFSFHQSSDVPVQVVTELYSNDTLATLISKLKAKSVVLDATAISKVIFGIVSGMASLHSRGVLHCDLKPNNVLLNERFEPIIHDFGLSRPYAGAVDLPNQIGSPLYMAPELNEEDGYDFAIDVYAFAITLYQIFADATELDDGKPPSKSPQQHLLRALKGARFVKKPEIPEYHWGVITRCWAQDPKARPTFQELLDEFHGNHEYVLPGADQSVVLAYETQVGTSFGAPNSRDLITNAPRQ
jgi:serine/threonine protein kinase